MKKLLLLVLILFGFISTSFAEYELTTSKNAKLDTTTYFLNKSVIKKDHYDFLLNLSDVKKLTKKNFNNKTYYVYEGQIISQQTYTLLSRKSREDEDLNLFLKLASKNQNIVSDFLYYSNGKLKSETRSLKANFMGNKLGGIRMVV